MAFFEDQQVDDASKRSDESVTALMALFSQENGFICRPLVPDKGSDFLVELVTEGKNARNWHFAVQLKCVVALEHVDNGEWITYPFKTSRLGYLSRQVPNLGIIVVYDHAGKACYYD
jgi:hypothetical protein